MNDDLAIEASGLVKSYRDVPVLDGVDLEIPRGSVFALLGPNGAGKTTTVRILATLTEADAGRPGWQVSTYAATGRPSAAGISLTGQFAALDEAQTGEENLRMMGRWRGYPERRPSARGRADRAVRPDRGRPAPGGHLLRRDAPPARHRGQPGRSPVGDLPGRAVDRA